MSSIQNSLLTIAHAGETHSSEAVATAHELAWFIQLPLFVLTLSMIAAAAWLVTKKVDSTLLVVSFVMLVSSFLLFEIAPLVSVLSITLGLLMTLFVTFVGLGTEG